MKKVVKVIIIVVIGVLLVRGLYLHFNKPETKKEDIKKYVVFKNKTIKRLDYKVSIDNNWVLIKAKKSLNEDTRLFEIEENEKYQYGDSYLTLKDGIPTIYNKEEVLSKVKNVVKIYLVIGDYNHQFAFLTKDGDIYIGKSIISINDNGEYILEFNDVSKLESKNNYKEINIIEVTNNKDWKSDDVIEYHFIGITKMDTKDLITINYDD